MLSQMTLINPVPMATLKSNRGNRRTGPARGRSGRPGSIPWRDDPVVRERVNLVRSLTAQGYTSNRMLPVITAWCRERGVLPVTLSTVFDDRVRARELLCEERLSAASTEREVQDAHLDELREVQVQSWSAFFAAGKGSNRAGYLNAVRGAVEAMMRLDGSAAPARVRLVADAEEDERQSRFAELMEEFVPDPDRRRELALRLIRPELGLA
jgi:hypothetical protein